ncbi:MAG: DNA polymerase II [Acidobacteriota bacterium]|nr:DNA polymerase II [Acidobacteriota bacterium]
METYDAFLLTTEWLDENDKHEIRVYGKSAALGPVELIFDETKPVFFVDREEKLPALDFDFERKPVGLKTFRDRPVDALYFNSWRDQTRAAERFKATGVRAFETDVRPPDRFLMERFVYSRVKIAGEYTQNGKLATFRNPKIKNGPAAPMLNILSLDIETGYKNGRLYSIGCHLTGEKEESVVFMLADERRDMPENLSLYPSEKAVLKAFLDWFQQADPDFIIGWHVVGFDLMFLDRKCRDLGMTLDLSRSDRPILLTEKPGAGYFATISGRVVIDGIPAIRGAGYVFPNYKLETVAQEILQTGKLITPEQDKVGEIERQFREDKAALARYNLEDCVLVTRLFEKIDLFNLTRQRCFFSGMMPDQLGIPNAPLDYYYLPKLHRKGLVAPNVPSNPMEPHLPPESASSARRGVYEQVAVLDFVNVLPSLVRIFKIDPLAMARKEVDPVKLPNGRSVSGTEHLLPELFERLTARLDQARDRGDVTTCRAIELQLKNFHKVLHAQTNRFYQPALVENLAAAENWLVTQARKFLEEKGYDVISADAEAVFLILKPADLTNPGAAAERIADEMDAFFRERLEAKYGFSAIKTSYRAFYSKLLIHPVKEKKRYAGRTPEGKIVQDGLDEAVKELTGLGEIFLTELLKRFLEDDGAEAWITEFVDRFKQGEMDLSLLVYRKKIRKRVEDYAKNAPPHIRAARMLDKVGKDVSYVFTLRGPVPIELDHTDVDHEHYIGKQIEPLADLVLTLVDKCFAKLSQPEQISLF